MGLLILVAASLLPSLAAADYTPTTPDRILDTRPVPNLAQSCPSRPSSSCLGPVGPGPSEANVLTVQITGTRSVPSSATAVAINVAVTNPTAASYLTVYPADAARPLAANLTFVPNQTTTNLVVVKLSALGQIDIYNSAGSVDVIADVQGYFLPQRPNPNQVAVLRWYGANQAPTAFPTGLAPQGVAFDGANVWIANSGDDTVTKLRANDGACVGAVGTDRSACTFTLGTSYYSSATPRGIAFDGANIWVANNGQYANGVSKLRVSDGSSIGSYGTGSPYGTSHPSALAFDGSSMWVADNGSNLVTKLRATDGACVGQLSQYNFAPCTYTVGNNPSGVAFDGSSIWVSNQHDNTVSKLRSSDGACVGTCTFNVGKSPSAVAFDGASIWVTNVSDNTVTKLRAGDGACVGTCTFAVGGSPAGLAFDGSSVWVSNGADGTVTRLRASDGAKLGTFSVGTIPVGVAFDGANIWVANRTANTVSKL